MGTTTILLFISIGLAAGIASGLIGIGGGVVMVPALVFIVGMSQHQAQGVSISTMLLPIGVLAFMNYYQAGHVTKTTLIYAGIMSAAFMIGGFFGSKISMKLNENILKIIFGLFMLYVACRMMFDGFKNLYNG